MPRAKPIRRRIDFSQRGGVDQKIVRCMTYGIGPKGCARILNMTPGQVTSTQLKAGGAARLSCKPWRSGMFSRDQVEHTLNELDRQYDLAAKTLARIQRSVAAEIRDIKKRRSSPPPPNYFRGQNMATKAQSDLIWALVSMGFALAVILGLIAAGCQVIC